MDDPQEDTAGDTPSDASVDILVGLVAIVLLATLLIQPIAQFGEVREQTMAQVDIVLQKPMDLKYKGQSIVQLIAQDASVMVVREAGNLRIAIDDILDDTTLSIALEAARAGQKHPLIFIEATGHEAAFLLETTLARAGFADTSRVYLDPSCAFLRPVTNARGCQLAEGLF